MNINRHNYETFFLLYVDRELSAVERKAVEQFVEENTDLKTELQLLLETALPSEPISFNAKNLLYKNEVDQDILQENLLLHLDNELNPAAAEKLIAAIDSDNAVKREWEIFQQIKLDANEKIIFENKELLYRHERDRVISMNFWRIAVAAAILFAGLFFGIRLLTGNKTTENTIAKKTTQPAGRQQKNDIPGPNNNTSVSSKTNAPENTASINDRNKREQQKEITPEAISKSTVIDKNSTVVNDQLIKKQDKVLPKTPLENINNPKSNETKTSTVLYKNSEPVLNNQATDEIANVPMNGKITAPKAPIIDYSVTAIPDSYAKTTVLQEETPDNDNKILYMNEKNVSRTKIGGLLRRVKRVITRNANINTDNGVRIAGFEIAVK